MIRMWNWLVSDVPLQRQQLNSSELWVAWEDLVLNAALSLLDLEESLHSPWWAPWVSAEPVGSTVLNTVTEDLDGVTTGNIGGGWGVDSWLIVEEVSVDGESTFNWTVGNDLRLDLLNTLRLSDWTVDARVLLLGWTVNALWSASWGVAWTSGVWEAAICDNSVLVEEFPSHIHVTTIATVVVGVTADQVFWWEDNVDWTVWGNGESVGESLGGTESPAGTALLLISDGVDLASPLLSGIEVVWGGDEWGTWVLFVWWNDVGTALGKELFLGQVTEWVGGGFVWLPESGLGLDVGDHLFVDWVGGSDHSGNGADDNELEHYVYVDLINYYYNSGSKPSLYIPLI